MCSSDLIRKQSLHQASQASLSQGQKTQQMPPRKLTRSLNWKAQVAQAHLDYCYSEHVFLLFLSLPFSLSLRPSFLHLWILLLLYGSHSVTALGRRREGCHRRSPSSRAEQVSLPWLLQQFPRIKNTLVCCSLVAQTAKNLPKVQETGVRSLGLEDPLEEGSPV